MFAAHPKRKEQTYSQQKAEDRWEGEGGSPEETDIPAHEKDLATVEDDTDQDSQP